MNPSETGTTTPTPEQEGPTVGTPPSTEARPMPTSTLAEAPQPIDTTPPETTLQSNHMEATSPTVEEQPKPEERSFFQKIGDFFRGKPKESKIPSDVVNTGPSPSAGQIGEQDAARKAALEAQGDASDTLGLPRVMTKTESQRLPHGDQASNSAEATSPEQEDQQKAA
jgi:hypothetical protein